LEMLFDRAFTVEVENRFQSCEEFLTRLEMALNPPSSVEDPAEVAAEVGRILRQHDRMTLLMEYAHYAQKLIQKLVQHASALAQRVKPPFGLSIGGLLVTNTLPQGIDGLGNVGFSLNVSVHAHHGRLRLILFTVGAEGNQCILLRGTITQQGMGGRPAQPDPNWEKLLWFNPDQLPTDEQLVAIVNQSASKAMRELGDDILSGGLGRPA
jgi:hypothetical protein